MQPGNDHDDLVVKDFPLELLKAAAPEYDARFVMSASSPDRVKDTIDPAAYLPNLGRRIIALWQHDRDNPIGFWENLKVDAGRLIGDIKFASTQLGQIAKQLIADGVPLGASIGARVKRQPLENGGDHFTALDIFETSIVSVPAHPLAVRIAKQFGFTLPTAAGQTPARVPLASQPSSAAAARVPPHGVTNMNKTISELVVDTQAAQVALVDKLAAESVKLGAANPGTDEYTTQKALVDQIDVDLQAVDAKLASLKSAETRLAKGAAPASTDNAGGTGSRAPGFIHRESAKDTDMLLGKLALCVYESRCKQLSIERIAAERFPNSQAVDTMIKAAVNPAMSNVPGYAQELTRQAYGQLMDMLRAEEILAQCVPAGQSHSFDGNAAIYVPTVLGGPADAAGVFRAEGAPIPVKGLTFGHVMLNPKNLGVILTATEEMLRRSSIDLASYFQTRITKDTAYSLDLIFTSNSAATAISPAGARNGLTVADTRASTGATADKVMADVKAMITGLTAANMGGPNTKWLMNPSNAVAISFLQTATGSKQFPEVAASNQLAGFPIVKSLTMPVNIVLLIDFEQYSFAIGNPGFLASNVATLHEDNAPSPISTAGAPNVVAAPVRSLYQTNSWALRMVMDADWVKMRTPGPVQELTAVAW